MDPVLTVDRLSVSYGSALSVVRDVSFTLGPGEVLGLVGESGSGKTTVALSLLGYRPWNARISGRIALCGTDVLALPPSELQALRGRKISYVPQNPTTALNPARTIGSLLGEFLVVHHLARSPAEDRNLLCNALRAFNFTAPEQILSRYPHQLSGGQQQRIALALATICNPAVVVLDEPTTGLDVSTQKTVLTLLAKLRVERRVAMVYVTHDLSILAEIATHIGVLYAGQLVEVGAIQDVLEKPLHPYTRGLLASRPDIVNPLSQKTGLRGLLKREELPDGCPFAPRCDLAVPACWNRMPPPELVEGRRWVACDRWRLAAPPPTVRVEAPVLLGSRTVLELESLSVAYKTAGPLSIFRSAPAVAVRDATIKLTSGEVLAIVGESGSGKSTLAKAVAGLVPAQAGRLRLDGEDLAFDVARRSPAQRRRLQLVFQNPDASLNPRRRVGQIIADALRSFESLDRAAIDARVRQSLAEVKLPNSYAERFPDQLSGGERQRVAIARALVIDPQVLICDEVLSALDVSVQAGILELLRGLAQHRRVAILFISHDLAVVRAIAQRIAVLHRGRFVALTTSADLLTPPIHPYLQELLAALPGQPVGPMSIGRPPSSSVGEEGCSFAPRCPVRIDGLCDQAPPPWRGTGTRLRCHQHDDNLLTHGHG